MQWEYIKRFNRTADFAKLFPIPESWIPVFPSGNVCNSIFSTVLTQMNFALSSSFHWSRLSIQSLMRYLYIHIYQLRYFAFRIIYCNVCALVLGSHAGVRRSWGEILHPWHIFYLYTRSSWYYFFLNNVKSCSCFFSWRSIVSWCDVLRCKRGDE